MGINRTVWGTKLLLTAVLASLVESTSLCHILKAQHWSLSPNGCFNPLLLSYLPPPPTCSTSIDSIYDITGAKKLSEISAAFK